MDERLDSFNDGYDAHEDGMAKDDCNVHDPEYFKEGWLAACHYAGGGSYVQLQDGKFCCCDDHRGAGADREPIPPQRSPQIIYVPHV